MQMHDLSHWDSNEEFTAAELAALVAGFDPNDPAAPHFKAVPIMKMIVEGHRVARAMVATPISGDEFKRFRASRHFEHALVSTMIEAFPLNQKAPEPGDPDRIYELPRQLQGAEGELDQQRFARAEVARWLGVMGVHSKYPFVAKSDAPVVGVTEPNRPAPTPATAPGWTLKKPKRHQAYTEALYQTLLAAHGAGEPRPNARNVLDSWRENMPSQITGIKGDGFYCYDANGEKVGVTLDSLRKAIGRLTE